jgi:hypothetical protein
MSSKRKVLALAGRPSKGNEQSTCTHICQNSLCKRGFQSSRGLLLHLSITPICSASFSTNRTSSPPDLDSSDRKPASKESVEVASLMEPDNDGLVICQMMGQTATSLKSPGLVLKLGSQLMMRALHQVQTVIAIPMLLTLL